jgi:hypothetical protein
MSLLPEVREELVARPRAGSRPPTPARPRGASGRPVALINREIHGKVVRTSLGG